MTQGYGYALAALIGAAGAWYVQGLRWDSDVAAIRHTADQALVVNVDAVNQQLIASRGQTEAIRQTFIEYKAGKENETIALERAVADGSKRLRVKASCPAVPPEGTIPGGARERGTAELDAVAGQDYFTYRRAYLQQVAEYKFCWRELRKRSAK